jgi:hypothetical protein
VNRLEGRNRKPALHHDSLQVTGLAFMDMKGTGHLDISKPVKPSIDMNGDWAVSFRACDWRHMRF